MTSVDETSSGSDIQTRYVDGVKNRQRSKKGEFAGTVEAYTYPDILEQRKPLGFTYRVTTAKGFQIHLVYNARFSPGGVTHKQSEVDLISWDFTTLPIGIPNVEMSAHLVVDTSVAYPATVQAFEDVLYGTDSYSSRLPSPDEVLEIFEEHSILRVIDDGDGTYTVIGPDEAITMLDSTTYEINWPSAVWIDSDYYTLSSL